MHGQLYIHHGGKLYDRIIQVTLILLHIWFWHVIGQVEQRLFVMFSDDGERRAYVCFEAQATTIKRKAVINRECHACKNGTCTRWEYMIPQKSAALYLLGITYPPNFSLFPTYRFHCPSCNH